MYEGNKKKVWSKFRVIILFEISGNEGQPFYCIREVFHDYKKLNKIGYDFINDKDIASLHALVIPSCMCYNLLLISLRGKPTIEC